MLCRCVTTQTDRSEKLNCYFAVVFSDVAIINNFNQIKIKEKQPLEAEWEKGLICKKACMPRVLGENKSSLLLEVDHPFIVFCFFYKNYLQLEMAPTRPI